jgi:hypothetical protein
MLKHLYNIQQEINNNTVNKMLSRSIGRHKTTFQRLPMSFNHRLTNGIIICFGLFSSLAALLMIIDFVGLEPDYQKVLEISNQALASVADSLTALANTVVAKTASIQL